MNTISDSISRRLFLQGTACVLAAPYVSLVNGFGQAVEQTPEGTRNKNLYADLLKTWCDALMELQIVQPDNPSLDGMIRCPDCKGSHGRCADALYPLMRMARVTGDSKYLDAAVRVQRWSDNVTQADGSWLNEVSGSSWKGITVFGSISLADALHYHGDLLDTDVKTRWMDRLSRAMTFLDGFMRMDSADINYPVTSSYAFALAGKLLDNKRYLEKARSFARSSLSHFTQNHFLFGEGKPITATTPKGARPIDLGYNVEESLPALALYSLLLDDKEVLSKTVDALRTHMEFMLPDGGWDNSWGSRMNKWTWWGSRTSDGCQPAYALLADHDPRFREVAWRNLEQLASCTHDGLLHGGPHLHLHGVKPCVHHTFEHAKALTCVLDHGLAMMPERRIELPREKAYGLKTYPEIATSLIAIGPWRATVTENDFEYKRGVNPSGGALSLLYHTGLGPILAASMTEYSLIEPHNQQKHGDYPTMCLTPRIELTEANMTLTSLSDTKAVIKSEQDEDTILIYATGRLQSIKHAFPQAGEIRYRLDYCFSKDTVKLSASIISGAREGVRLIVPVIATQREIAERVDAQTISIQKPDGLLHVKTDLEKGFEKLALDGRVFNLVPGLVCLPIVLSLPPNGQEISIVLSNPKNH